MALEIHLNGLIHLNADGGKYRERHGFYLSLQNLLLEFLYLSSWPRLSVKRKAQHPAVEQAQGLAPGEAKRNNNACLSPSKAQEAIWLRVHLASALPVLRPFQSTRSPSKEGIMGNITVQMQSPWRRSSAFWFLVCVRAAGQTRCAARLRSKVEMRGDLCFPL